MTSGSNCRHLNKPQTEEARRSIRPAYHGLPAKLQHCPFANLILVGWLNDAGNYGIFVQNTETKKLQKVTSEPNKDHFRIIELRPNADPKLVEAVMSNGTDQ